MVSSRDNTARFGRAVTTRLRDHLVQQLCEVRAAQHHGNLVVGIHGPRSGDGRSRDHGIAWSSIEVHHSAAVHRGVEQGPFVDRSQEPRTAGAQQGGPAGNRRHRRGGAGLGQYAVHRGVGLGVDLPQVDRTWAVTIRAAAGESRCADLPLS
jgi:hypothetical protein